MRPVEVKRDIARDNERDSLNCQMVEAFSQIDGTIAQSLELAAEMVGSFQRFGLRPSEAQNLLRTLQALISNLIDARESLVLTQTIVNRCCVLAADEDTDCKQADCA